ncbi:MAG: domain protein beta barrel domain protein [Frankiales bacterium]|nr:domain protein beta barrel domain protein [Frankiales bacterium]
MKIAQVWRFPVKSLQGELIESVLITPDGLDGDRRFAIFDVESGFGLTARRVPELLFAKARLRADGGVQITLPNGRTAADDAALSSWLGRSVELRSADDSTPRRYEYPADFEQETAESWAPFDGAHGSFHDSSQATVSLLSTGTIGALEALEALGSTQATGVWPLRRFRANVILDEAGEDDFVGRQIALGQARLDVGMQIARCVMVTRPQPDHIDRDVDVLRTIHRERQGFLAVGATVAQAGTISVGDSISALDSFD